MKKRGFAAVIIILLLIIAVFKLTEQRSGSADSADGLIQEIALRNSGQSLQASEDQLYAGDLLLVNGDYPMRPQGTQPDVTELFGHSELTGPASLLDRDIRLSRGVAMKFVVMADAAANEGIEHFLISSGYRDELEQSRLYKEKGSDYALPPGYSEHHLGLALDIGSTEGPMAEAKEGKWLEKNAARYGFVLRYPADKTGITGISFEPWHFRYVGLPHSLLMQKNNLVLEEYLAMLEKKEAISTTVNGREYVVCYYGPDRLSELKIPKGRDYALSGDNRGGLILTLYP
ncbi:M15 family metallopeptidase [Saccharibacillus endophyticus]|uniref:D-Ala-D-Ala carboxypeptidase VanY n=1 Tax=Saccharibacillus endophyticus TaxID=2060666 RepID=A0ABQ2A6W2_9BACL|nr:M15 family metallopeptidase [Saccharibacillus endophyticus]GGH85709.1 D-Ala-D-Ala carboxypeptidase VanY [Saccharibacillus endophyticus]